MGSKNAKETGEERGRKRKAQEEEGTRGREKRVKATAPRTPYRGKRPKAGIKAKPRERSMYESKEREHGTAQI